MGVLTGAPAVMIWRRISDLGAAKNFFTKTMSWPRVGTNQYAVVSDTGNVLLGHWVQALLAGGCSKLDFNKFDLVSNTGSELVVASRSMRPAVASIRAVTKLPMLPPTNGTTSFVDPDGNYTALIRSKGLLKGQAARKLAALLKTGVSGVGKARRALANPLVGYTLLVTDLKASARFYRNVLGLRALARVTDSISFDIGTMILTLKREPALGLVRSLNKRRRLEGDWVVFHVKDIEKDVKALKGKGVKFPKGIEESVHGLGAYFTDLDGYSYGLWVPPDKHDAIDYFPELQRILKSVAWLKVAGAR